MQHLSVIERLFVIKRLLKADGQVSGYLHKDQVFLAVGDLFVLTMIHIVSDKNAVSL